MPPKPPHQSIIQTEFDERTIGRSTQLLKALIPFLEPSQQKMFGLMVRIIEFNMTLDFFNHNRIPACMFKPPCGDDMLSELKGYCSPEEQKQLDMMIGMIKAQKIQAALNSNPCPPPTPGKPPCVPGGRPPDKPSGAPCGKPTGKPPLLPAIILAASLMALQTIILVAGRMTLRVTNRRKSLHVPVTPAMVSSMKIRTTGQIAVLRQNHLISLLRSICSQDFCHRNS